MERLERENLIQWIVIALIAIGLFFLPQGCVTDGNRTRHNPTPIICER